MHLHLTPSLVFLHVKNSKKAFNGFVFRPILLSSTWNTFMCVVFYQVLGLLYFCTAIHGVCGSQSVHMVMSVTGLTRHCLFFCFPGHNKKDKRGESSCSNCCIIAWPSLPEHWLYIILHFSKSQTLPKKYFLVSHRTCTTYSLSVFQIMNHFIPILYKICLSGKFWKSLPSISCLNFGLTFPNLSVLCPWLIKFNKEPAEKSWSVLWSAGYFGL